MHEIIYSIRQIPTDQLPTLLVDDVDSTERRLASDAELLNMGLQRLHDDVFSCAEPFDSRIEPDASGRPHRIFFPVGDALPGERLSAGTVIDRHESLPIEYRPKVFRADAFRATALGGSAIEIVASVLNEQVAAIEEYVGETPIPILDPTTEATVITEAERIAALPDRELARNIVPMITINPAADLVVEDGLIPHVWAGERY